MGTEPRTLQQAIIYFSDADNCLNYLAARRWKNGVVVCPTCGSTEVSFLPSRRLWQCRTRHPKAQFSIKVGTIFEDSPIGLDKWLLAMWQLANCKNGISSWELHRATGISQKSCWFMLQRIRLALQDDLTGGMLGGEVEVDETFIGGKVRNMHKARKARVQKHSQKGDKAIVLGIIERASKDKPKRIRTSVLKDRKRDSMLPEILAHVERGSKVHSDEFAQAWRDDNAYDHQVVNHLSAYVNGNVHTNSVENFWSLLKRGLNGTYISVEPFHLFRYVDEQSFRFNNRIGMEDWDRFDLAVGQIVGRRLTWEQVTGKDGKKSDSAI